MISIKEENNLFSISFIYKDAAGISKKINLSRSKDEYLETTFLKIKAKLPRNEASLQLYDLENNQLSLQSKNRDVWKDGYSFSIENQIFKVKCYLSLAKSLKLSKKLFAGMPIFCSIEAEHASYIENLHKHSIFTWFVSNVDHTELQWTLICSGVGKRMCLLSEDWANKMIKVECIPKIDNSKEEGNTIDAVSNKIEEKINLTEFPMTYVHTNLTQDSLNLNK